MNISPIHLLGRAGWLGVWIWFAAPVLAGAQPVEVIPPELRGAIQPQVAVAANRKVYVVFGKEDRIYCRWSDDDGKTFQAAGEVATLPKLALGMRRGPRVVAADDRVTVSAVSHQDGNLYAWTSATGGWSWSQGVAINSAAGRAGEGLHAMAGDQRGNIFAVWLDGRNKGTQLWGASSRDGGRTWGDNVKIYQSPDGHICECCNPSVEMEANGVVRVMWRNWLGGSRDLYTASSADGGRTFGSPAKLGSGTWVLNGCPMDGGNLAGPYAVWRRESTVYYTDGGVTEHSLGPGKQPTVVLAKDGPYFVWQDDARLLMQKGPALPVVFSPAGAYPSLAAASADQAPIAVWESTTNGSPTILAEVLR